MNAAISAGEAQTESAQARACDQTADFLESASVPHRVSGGGPWGGG
jgi:hypothetical protein